MRKLIIAATAFAFVASTGLVSAPVFAQSKPAATSGDTMSKGHMSKMSKKKMSKKSKKMAAPKKTDESK